MTEQQFAPRQNKPNVEYHDQPDEFEDAFNPDVAQKDWLRKWGKLGGAALLVVSVAAGAGIAIGTGRGGDKVGAQAPPVATAPANPTEQPSAIASEAQPTSSIIDTTPIRLLTPETFPLKTPNGTFEGIKEYKKNQLLVGDYQGSGKKEIKQLIHDFTAQRNIALNAGMDQIESGEFDNYSMQYDHPVFDSKETATGDTAVLYTYDKAFQESFIDDKDFAAREAAAHSTVLQFRKGEEAPSYTASYTVGQDGSDPTYLQGRKGVTFMDVKTTYTDSLGNKDILTETLHFTPVIEEDGRAVWKVTNAQSETAE